MENRIVGRLLIAHPLYGSACGLDLLQRVEYLRAFAGIVIESFDKLLAGTQHGNLNRSSPVRELNLLVVRHRARGEEIGKLAYVLDEIQAGNNDVIRINLTADGAEPRHLSSGELSGVGGADNLGGLNLRAGNDLKLVASSLALNDALDVGDGSATPPATLAAMTEFAWQEDGETRLSDTLQTTIINDIIRLASDAPEAATGEYPAPDLVATKSWVNSKQATADTAGFVMLGTNEPISGKNVRPVGKTSSGGLAVDVSGMSAYEVAVANGFVGTEEAWLASLKGERGSRGEQGEPGDSAYQIAQKQGFQGTEEEWLASLAQAALEESAEMAPPAGEESNYDAYGFGIIMPHSGMLNSLEVDCRQGASNAGTEPVWCKVWRDEVLVALSLNSQVHKAYETLKWEFSPFAVEAGQEYKFIFYKEGSKDHTSFSTDFQGCFRVVRKDSSDGVGMIGVSGGYLASGATEWQPRYKLHFRNVVYTPLCPCR